MAKSTTAKTNGHTVAALKPAAPRKAAAKPAAKPAAKAAVKPAARPAAKPAAKAAARKPAAKTAVKPAAKAAVKPAAKAAVKPAAKAAVKPAAAPARPVARKAAVKKVPTSKAQAAIDVPEVTAEEREKTRKAKLVRDSFTMPEQEYAVLGQVKKACLKAGFEIKKSELLRIGVALISQLDMATLQKVLGSLPQLKTGRPKSE